MKVLSDNTDGAVLQEKTERSIAEPTDLADLTASRILAARLQSASPTGPAGTGEPASAGFGKQDAELDRFGVGLFQINKQGYVFECNETASEILGLDHQTPWNERHIANLDRSLKTGVHDQFEAIIEGDVRFVRRRFRALNRRGQHLLISVHAAPYSNGNGRGVLGIIQEIDRASDRTILAREELHILAEVAAALSSSLELSQILRVILTGATASQGLGFNRAFLMLYDESRHRLVGHMAVGPTSAEEAGNIWERLDGQHLSLGQLLDDGHAGSETGTGSLSERIRGVTVDLNADSLIATACDDGRPVNLERTSDIDPLTTDFLDCLGTRQAALVPLVSKGVCRGLLAADNFFTKAPISDDAVRVAKILADQAAVAIQRARLFDVERKRTRQLEEANRRLARSQDQIIRAEKMSVMGELTSSVAQELCNPLTIVDGFVNLLLEMPVADDLREYVNIIASEVQRTHTVLDQVLQFASVSHQCNQQFDFSMLIADCLEKLHSSRGRSTAAVQLSMAPQKLTAYGNREQLASAVYQLLNLIADEVVPYATVRARTEQQGDRVRLVLAFSCPNERENCMQRSLEQVFARQTSSQRLPVVVAGETIKYHGGDYGMAAGNDGNPIVFMELPRHEERCE